MTISSGNVWFLLPVSCRTSALIRFMAFCEGLIKGNVFPVFGFFTNLIANPRKLNPSPFASMILVFSVLRLSDR